MDANGNPIGSDNDLAKDGAYEGCNVLIGKFVNCKAYTNADFKSGPGAELEKKGFTFTLCNTEAEFIQHLYPSGQTTVSPFKVAWIISNKTGSSLPQLADACYKFSEQGGGL